MEAPLLFEKYFHLFKEELTTGTDFEEEKSSKITSILELLSGILYLRFSVKYIYARKLNLAN